MERKKERKHLKDKSREKKKPYSSDPESLMTPDKNKSTQGRQREKERE